MEEVSSTYANMERPQRYKENESKVKKSVGNDPIRLTGTNRKLYTSIETDIFLEKIIDKLTLYLGGHTFYFIFLYIIQIF